MLYVLVWINLLHGKIKHIKAMKNFKDLFRDKINLFSNLPLNHIPKRSHYCGKKRGFQGKQ